MANVVVAVMAWMVAAVVAVMAWMVAAVVAAVVAIMTWVVDTVMVFEMMTMFSDAVVRHAIALVMGIRRSIVALILVFIARMSMVPMVPSVLMESMVVLWFIEIFR